MDIWVAAAQMWVNSTYAGRPGYVTVPETGQTGWPTMYALTRALQIELGISTPSDNFGAGTLSSLTSQVGNVTAGDSANVIGIMQCGLFCKGYWGGATFGTWESVTASSLNTMTSQMGLSAVPSLAPKAFKSLLTMSPYILTSGGRETVQAVQRWLNGAYIGRSDYFLIPCDGHHSRDVQRGLMYGIQYELGMADGTANGNFGPGTQSGLQTYGSFGLGASDSTRRLVRLFQAALILNGYDVPFDGVFGTATRDATLTFQGFAQLTATGSANFQTWASLLVSTGDPSRPGTACDTDTPLDAAKAAALYAAGYRTVGRYLNGTTKRLTVVEPEVMFDAGLTMFFIYQEWNNSAAYLTNAIGRAQGAAAVLRARQLGIPPEATIFFPVDWDATDADIDAVVFDYFQGVVEGAATSSTVSYRIGVYGTRNVCARVCAEGFAVASFVAGMSTGWSGNLGFPLPSTWWYDQIQGLTVGSGSSAIGIDKNIKSSSAQPTAWAELIPTPRVVVDGVPGYDDYHWWLSDLGIKAEIATAGSSLLSEEERADILLHHLADPVYNDVKWYAFTPKPEDVFTIPQQIRNAVAGARSAYEPLAPTRPATAEYVGDTAHWAASANGHRMWGAAEGATTIQIGDLGGWALDLVTLWDEYAARRRAGTYLEGIASWIQERLGSRTVASTFAHADLVADVDAYLVARMRGADQDRSVADCMREILTESQEHPTWRFQQFYAHRFGFSSAVKDCVRHLFEADWEVWVTFPVSQFIETRRPGQHSDPGDPIGIELDDELEDLARAFSSRLSEFVTDPDPDGP